MKKLESLKREIYKDLSFEERNKVIGGMNDHLRNRVTFYDIRDSVNVPHLYPSRLD